MILETGTLLKTVGAVDSCDLTVSKMLVRLVSVCFVTRLRINGDEQVMYNFVVLMGDLVATRLPGEAQFIVHVKVQLRTLRRSIIIMLHLFLTGRPGKSTSLSA